MSDKNEKMNAIDKAIVAAKARKATKDTANGEKPAKAPKAEKPAPKRPRLTDEQKAERKAKLEADRAERKAARELKRAEKKAEREANRKPAHMSKVLKAGAKLPTLDKATESLFNEATANLTASGIAVLVAHLSHFNRVKATERAAGQKVNTGDTVRITGGDVRYLGMEGTVTKAQRIRCYVDVGAKKPVYLFTSDVEVTTSAVVAEKTGTEG